MRLHSSRHFLCSSRKTDIRDDAGAGHRNCHTLQGLWNRAQGVICVCLFLPWMFFVLDVPYLTCCCIIKDSGNSSGLLCSDYRCSFIGSLQWTAIDQLQRFTSEDFLRIRPSPSARTTSSVHPNEDPCYFQRRQRYQNFQFYIL